MTWRANYHTHSRWSDGESEITDLIDAALTAGLTSVGISCHAPVPFPTTYALPMTALHRYREEVLRLRNAYAGQIEVVLGLELDALPELRQFNTDEVLALGFDYTVGSVHYQRTLPSGEPWGLDISEALFADLLHNVYQGDIQALVEEHYRAMAALAAYPGVTIIGHLDRGVKLWNSGDKYFSEAAPWYRAAVEQTLRAYVDSGRIVEVSTGGWRKGLADPFPSPWIIQRCHELGVWLTLNTDGHRPAEITTAYDRAQQLLCTLGINELARYDLSTATWHLVPIADV